MHGKTKQFDGKKKEQIFSILFLKNKKMVYLQLLTMDASGPFTL
jgi:hypothetical protein